MLKIKTQILSLKKREEVCYSDQKNHHKVINSASSTFGKQVRLYIENNEPFSSA